VSDHTLTTQVQEAAQRLEPLLVGADDVAALLGVGLSCLYAMDRSGELGPRGLYLRRRRLWPVAEVQAWVRAGCPRREIWNCTKKSQEVY
jgi:predicted DNA-binding transcriptional regulator AlpA